MAGGAARGLMGAPPGRPGPSFGGRRRDARPGARQVREAGRSAWPGSTRADLPARGADGAPGTSRAPKPEPPARPPPSPRPLTAGGPPGSAATQARKRNRGREERAGLPRGGGRGTGRELPLGTRCPAPGALWGAQGSWAAAPRSVSYWRAALLCGLGEARHLGMLPSRWQRSW